MGDEDLVVISWNVEKKTLRQIREKPEITEAIVRSIAEEVTSMGASGAETPFVAYLLEIKGNAGDVREMCEEFRYAYYKLTKQNVDVVADYLGGSSSTNEYIVTMYRKVNIANRELGAGSKLREVIEVERRAAQDAFDAKMASRVYRSGSKLPGENIFRRNTKDFLDFRDGLTSDFEMGGVELRVAVAHAPGPSVVKKFPESVDAIRDAASETKSEILIGDFNRDGDFAGSGFNDIMRSRNKGTTLSKSWEKDGILKTGKRQRDRIFTRKKPIRRWEVTAYDPVIKGGFIDRRPLTDHAMIRAGMKRVLSEPPPFKKVKLSEDDDPFFINNNNEPNIFDADADTDDDLIDAGSHDRMDEDTYPEGNFESYSYNNNNNNNNNEIEDLTEDDLAAFDAPYLPAKPIGTFGVNGSQSSSPLLSDPVTSQATSALNPTGSIVPEAASGEESMAGSGLNTLLDGVSADDATALREILKVAAVVLE